MKADIKIWILTGDKQETAINIGKIMINDWGFDITYNWFINENVKSNEFLLLNVHYVVKDLLKNTKSKQLLNQITEMSM